MATMMGMSAAFAWLIALDGLRHDAVVRRDNEDCDIGAPCAPRARMEVNAS